MLKWWLDWFALDCIPVEEVGGELGIFIDLGFGKEFVSLPGEVVFDNPRDAYLQALGYFIGQKAKLVRESMKQSDMFLLAGNLEESEACLNLAKIILKTSEDHEKRILKKLADLDELLNPVE